MEALLAASCFPLIILLVCIIRHNSSLQVHFGSVVEKKALISGLASCFSVIRLLGGFNLVVEEADF